MVNLKGHQVKCLIIPTLKWNVVCRLAKIKEWVDKTDPGATILPFSGAVELKLSEMGDEEREAWCKEHSAQRFINFTFVI